MPRRSMLGDLWPNLGPPRDLDDGLYEDVNGNGRLGIGDAYTLYHERDSDAVQSNPRAFDFNDSGDVEMADAVALFQTL